MKNDYNENYNYQMGIKFLNVRLLCFIVAYQLRFIKLIGSEVFYTLFKKIINDRFKEV